MSVPPLIRILYVEDEPDIQAVARLSLEVVGGYQVSVCSSGSEAIAIAPSFEPDLILLDVMMPGLDGIRTLQALRELAPTAETPVIFMTAKVQTHEMSHYQTLGALGVIAKPFDPMALSAEVHNLWIKHHG